MIAQAPGTRSAARIAAISGFVFVILFVAALVLVHRTATLGDPDAVYAAFYANGGDQIFVAVGLYLVPSRASRSSGTRPRYATSSTR